MNKHSEYDSDQHSGDEWLPQEGSETKELLQHLQVDEASKRQLLGEAKRILSRCVEPQKPNGRETGLVMGYVQSGKTMSFTMVASLAQDNYYQLIIIMTGTSVNLTNQSIDRLRSDLRLDSRIDRKWWFRKNPQVDEDLGPILDRLEDRRDESVASNKCQTVLIAVMKHHKHLEHLTELLAKLPLEGVPCLIIDDEGDQASLNTKIKQGNESTTYRRIMELRSKVKHCSYLQYTATPQALLLINKIDVLSPSFAEILEPGQEYAGGEEFFSKQKGILRTIPSYEIFTQSNVPEEPPASLLRALLVFFIGVTIGETVALDQRCRTMLIHPSYRTMPHSVFTKWVKYLKDFYVEILGLPNNDPDRIDLTDEIRAAYDDLSRTVKDIPTFDEIMSGLRRSIRMTVVQEVNSTSGKTPPVDWNNSYSHVLIGGQAMDRGFTVEGLTVTYMPRGVGVGNVDTIQQRGRFYGYKKGYLNYCRVYLEEELQAAYIQYVDHERSMHTELVEFQESDQSLEEWKRKFLMPSRLKPTRSSVIDVEYMQGILSDKWYTSEWPLYELDAIESNRSITDVFIETLDWVSNKGHKDRTEYQRHMQNDGALLISVYEDLLMRLRFFDSVFTGILLQMKYYLESNLDSTCTVVRMSSDGHSWLTRKRGLNPNGKILNLMQGAHPNSRGRIYPGDRKIGDKNRAIVQIHRLELTQNDRTVEKDVIGLAIWIPASMSAAWLVQDQAM